MPELRPLKLRNVDFFKVAWQRYSVALADDWSQFRIANLNIAKLNLNRLSGSNRGFRGFEFLVLLQAPSNRPSNALDPTQIPAFLYKKNQILHLIFNIKSIQKQLM